MPFVYLEHKIPAWSTSSLRNWCDFRLIRWKETKLKNKGEILKMIGSCATGMDIAIYWLCKWLIDSYFTGNQSFPGYLIPGLFLDCKNSFWSKSDLVIQLIHNYTRRRGLIPFSRLFLHTWTKLKLEQGFPITNSETLHHRHIQACKTLYK